MQRDGWKKKLILTDFYVKVNFLKFLVNSKIIKMKTAVVGATGMVGQTMIKVLEERNFPADEFIPGSRVFFSIWNNHGKTNNIPRIEMKTIGRNIRFEYVDGTLPFLNRKKIK